jgi:hypothetical protein
VIAFLVFLIVLPVAAVMFAAAITNEPWTILIPYAFIWLAWPRKRCRSR